MHIKYESQLREPLVYGEKNFHQVTEDILRPIEVKPSRLWYIGFFIAVALLLFGVFSLYREVTYGIGQWNLNKTIGWGWDITNFVWWVGIGHAGTLISAVLLLFRQGWRTGDDYFCRYVCWSIPYLPHGSCLVSLLYYALS
jgi:molybdopterin-containing oxidoreductase family membrane subunit